MKKLILEADGQTPDRGGKPEKLFWANEAPKTPSREKTTNNLSHWEETLGMTEKTQLDNDGTAMGQMPVSAPSLLPDIPEGTETPEVHLSRMGQLSEENELSHSQTLASTDKSLSWDNGTEDREAFKLEDEVRPPVDWDELL